MDHSNPIILCVDDEPNSLVLRKLVLEKAGYRVLAADSLRRALEVLSSSQVDLVLSDQLMPGGTGTELARQVKALFPRLPVIIISGVNELPSDANNADLFISKTEGPAAMCENIASVLKKIFLACNDPHLHDFYTSVEPPERRISVRRRKDPVLLASPGRGLLV